MFLTCSDSVNCVIALQSMKRLSPSVSKDVGKLLTTFRLLQPLKAALPMAVMPTGRMMRSR